MSAARYRFKARVEVQSFDGREKELSEYFHTWFLRNRNQHYYNVHQPTFERKYWTNDTVRYEKRVDRYFLYYEAYDVSYVRKIKSLWDNFKELVELSYKGYVIRYDFMHQRTH